MPTVDPAKTRNCPFLGLSSLVQFAASTVVSQGPKKNPVPPAIGWRPPESVVTSTCLLVVSRAVQSSVAKMRLTRVASSFCLRSTWPLSACRFGIHWPSFSDYFNSRNPPPISLSTSDRVQRSIGQFTRRLHARDQKIKPHLDQYIFEQWPKVKLSTSHHGKPLVSDSVHLRIGAWIGMETRPSRTNTHSQPRIQNGSRRSPGGKGCLAHRAG